MNRSIGDRYQTGAGMFAWILHRLSGLILTIYMLAFVYTLRDAQQIAQDRERGIAAFDALLLSFNTPFWKLLHLIILLSALYHTFNGLRVLSFSTSWGLRYQRALFWVAFGLALAIFLFAAVVSFAGA